MKRLLWVSRHDPLPIQLTELQRILGIDFVCEVDSQPFSSAEQIKQRFVAGQYDDIAVVAPLSVIKKLVDLGVRPIWAEMEPIPCPAQPDLSRETEVRGRWYRFRRFRRVVGLQIEFEEL